MKMHIMYSGSYHVGFSERSSKRWFHYVYWGVVGWVLSGKVHKRTVFGNIALVLINQGFPLELQLLFSCIEKGFPAVASLCCQALQKQEVRFAGLCVVVLVEQMLKHSWSSVWAVWPQALALPTAEGLQKRGGCVLLGVAHTLARGWHVCYGTRRLKVALSHVSKSQGCENWALGKW